MKKLIMALVVAAVAVASNAATVNWKSGSNIQGPAGGTLAKNTWTMYVWDNLSATDYAALDVSTMYGTYSKMLDSAKSATIGTPSLGATVKNTTATDSTTYYAAVLFTYTDAEGKAWYIANKGTVTTDALGNGGSALNLAKTRYDGSAISGWTSAAVPEPTSGLLLLLGMAGLALKRKHA